MLVYDCEIQKMVQAYGEERIPGIQYCEGWQDFTGMGVACLVAFDAATASYRVFMPDNISRFNELANRDPAERIVGFNNLTFDDPLCMAAGIVWPREKSLDLARLIWRSAGVPEGEHPRGLSLEKLCIANGIGGKNGKAEMAPVLFQQGRFGELIDYCVRDVSMTLKLYRQVLNSGGLIDPRNQQWLPVVVPR